MCYMWRLGGGSGTFAQFCKPLELICAILCLVLVSGKTKAKLFLLLQWYFDLSKRTALVSFRQNQNKTVQVSS